MAQSPWWFFPQPAGPHLRRTFLFSGLMTWLPYHVSPFILFTCLQVGLEMSRAQAEIKKKSFLESIVDVCLYLSYYCLLRYCQAKPVYTALNGLLFSGLCASLNTHRKRKRTKWRRDLFRSFSYKGLLAAGPTEEWRHVLWLSWWLECDQSRNQWRPPTTDKVCWAIRQHQLSLRR